jgi:hypothetical protein
MDSANGQIAIVAGPGGKMGASLLSGLEYHSFRIMGIDAAVCQNGRRVDYKNTQAKAALAAAQAEHNTP